MKNHNILEKIENVRESLADVKFAYMYRSRLKRLIVACTRAVARKYKKPEPDFPEYVPLIEGMSDKHTNIIQSCNKLGELASNISQRSEPFHDRWMRDRDALLEELERLEKGITYTLLE